MCGLSGKESKEERPVLEFELSVFKLQRGFERELKREFAAAAESLDRVRNIQMRCNYCGAEFMCMCVCVSFCKGEEFYTFCILSVVVLVFW